MYSLHCSILEHGPAFWTDGNVTQKSVSFPPKKKPCYEVLKQLWGGSSASSPDTLLLCWMSGHVVVSFYILCFNLVTEFCWRASLPSCLHYNCLSLFLCLSICISVSISSLFLFQLSISLSFLTMTVGHWIQFSPAFLHPSAFST